MIEMEFVSETLNFINPLISLSALETFIGVCRRENFMQQISLITAFKELEASSGIPMTHCNAGAAHHHYTCQQRYFGFGCLVGWKVFRVCGTQTSDKSSTHSYIHVVQHFTIQHAVILQFLLPAGLYVSV